MAPLSSAPSTRVLSVQSHVVSGYCGNKSATFPLQLLGFEVDVVNTVQLSNHTQYEVAKGQIFSSKDLDELRDGLKANKLSSKVDLVLSGYVADVSYIESMAKLIADIKLERQRDGRKTLYTFDPVLGDDGVGFYVPGALKVAEAYKKNLMPLADIITPNRFEASALSGVEIDANSGEALKQTLEAIDVFHRMGVKIVVITSLAIKTDEDLLTCIVSCEGPEREVWRIHIPKLDCPFTGTGDLFAALFTAWLHKTHFDLKASLENTANSIHGILVDTLAYHELVGDNSAFSRELRLVQNKNKILSPGHELTAERI